MSAKEPEPVPRRSAASNLNPNTANTKEEDGT
jgi:hypothetical protein